MREGSSKISKVWKKATFAVVAAGSAAAVVFLATRGDAPQPAAGSCRCPWVVSSVSHLRRSRTLDLELEGATIRPSYPSVKKSRGHSGSQPDLAAIFFLDLLFLRFGTCRESDAGAHAGSVHAGIGAHATGEANARACTITRADRAFVILSC